MIAVTVVVDGWQLLSGIALSWLLAVAGQAFLNRHADRGEGARYRKLYLDLLDQMMEESQRTFDRSMAKNEVIDAARREAKWPSQDNHDALCRALIKHDAQYLDVPEGEPLAGSPPPQSPG